MRRRTDSSHVGQPNGAALLRPIFNDGQGCCTGRRCPLAFADVAGPPAFVFFRRQGFKFRFATLDTLVENLLEKWDAPATPCPSSAALGKLARHLRLVRCTKLTSFRRLTWRTDFVIEIHKFIPGHAGRHCWMLGCNACPTIQTEASQ